MNKMVIYLLAPFCYDFSPENYYVFIQQFQPNLYVMTVHICYVYMYMYFFVCRIYCEMQSDGNSLKIDTFREAITSVPGSIKFYKVDNHYENVMGSMRSS